MVVSWLDINRKFLSLLSDLVFYCSDVIRRRPHLFSTGFQLFSAKSFSRFYSSFEDSVVFAHSSVDWLFLNAWTLTILLLSLCVMLLIPFIHPQLTEHFSHHQTAAGITSSHPVSVYFNTFWNMHILGKISFSKHFFLQSALLSFISSETTFFPSPDLQLMLFLPKTSADKMVFTWCWCTKCLQADLHKSVLSVSRQTGTHNYLYQTCGDVKRHVGQSCGY